MPRSYKKGEIINNYEITSDGIVNHGEFAWSYFAKNNTGRKIFLKQYIDPTEYSPDNKFKKFITAQREFQKRLNKLTRAEQMYEVFEEEGIHYQAKEFMKGKDLKQYLRENHELSLEMRKYIAIVFVFALKTIHESGIVHVDLKPEQIYLEEDPSIEFKYQIKICDFDFSRIPGGFDPIEIVTTQYYSSPEHLNGEQIEYASDRFTAGLILYEVLVGVDNPYDIKTVEEYKNAVLKYEVNPPNNFLDMPEKLSDQIFSLLSPNMDKRCKLADIHQELIKWSKEEAEDREENEKEGKKEEVEKKVPKRIFLLCSSTSFTPSFHKSQIITRNELRGFSGYEVVSNQQFELIKGEKSWAIKGLDDVVNNTYLNGTNITGREQELNDGDTIFVGNIITKNGLELKIEFLKE